MVAVTIDFQVGHIPALMQPVVWKRHNMSHQTVLKVLTFFNVAYLWTLLIKQGATAVGEMHPSIVKLSPTNGSIISGKKQALDKLSPYILEQVPAGGPSRWASHLGHTVPVPVEGVDQTALTFLQGTLPRVLSIQGHMQEHVQHSFYWWSQEPWLAVKVVEPNGVLAYRMVRFEGDPKSYQQLPFAERPYVYQDGWSIQEDDAVVFTTHPEEYELLS